jgi:hypothetical protein
MIPLAVFEEIIDASGVAPRIEAMLPAGVRARQLTVRTLLAGMCLTQAGHRPAHLTRVHQALTTLPGDDQRRLGVVADWKHGPHRLTYRQTERTFGLVTGTLAKDEPDGLPSQALQAVCDDLLEASIPDQFKDASTSLAVDWTDLETFSRPPPAKGGTCADPEASWGTARTTGPAPKTSCSTATTSPPGSRCPRRTARPSPNSPAAPRCRPAGTTPSAPWSPS